MKKWKLSDSQIMTILKQVEAGFRYRVTALTKFHITTW